MSNWFLKVNGEILGPFNSTQIRRMAESGEVTPFSLIRKGREGTWSPASRVDGLRFSESDTTVRKLDGRPVKDCPFCAEEILSAAKKCKHCGEFLSVAVGQRESNIQEDLTEKNEKVKCANCTNKILPSTAAKYNGLCAPCGKGSPISRSGKKPNSKGIINPSMACPHCQVVGKVRTIPVVRKKGLSGGKATAAVITGGFSVLAVGLSRKENVTQAHCDNCRNTWII